MIYCGRCGTRNGWPMSSMRTSNAPCDVCNGFDQIEVKKHGQTTTRNLRNYSYPSNLLPTAVETETGEEVG